MELLPLVLGAIAIAICVAAGARALVLVAEAGQLDMTLREDREIARIAELAERKEMLFQLIASTNLDFETEKISATDRDRTLRRLEREAVQVMKEMDGLAGSEEDLNAARAALDTHIAAARQSAGEGRWSEAARRRHGGVAPEPAP